MKIWFNGTAVNKPHLLELHNTQYSNTSIDSLAELSKHENFTMTTVHNSGSSSHILTGLIPYAQYDVFLMPFYKLLLGKPSNMKTGLTEEDGNAHFVYCYDLNIRRKLFNFQLHWI